MTFEQMYDGDISTDSHCQLAKLSIKQGVCFKEFKTFWRNIIFSRIVPLIYGTMTMPPPRIIFDGGCGQAIFFPKI